MKVSPLAQGTGLPAGVSVGQERMPADRIAAAKAVAEGRNPIRITESDTYVDPMAKQAMKTIKMKTLASVMRDLPQEEVQEAESATEDAIGTTEPVQEETKPISPQLAAIAKQRRALQVKEREIQEREKALQTQDSSQGGSEALAARIKSDPLSVLQEHGVTYDQLTEAILSGQSGINPDIQALKAEIKALKEGVDKTLSEKDAATEKAVLAEMRREAESLIREGDAFEMVRETRSLDDAMNLITQTYKETGEVLDVQEALALVEEELINETLKIANIKKVKSKLAPPAVPQLQQPQKTMRTLTNRDSSSIVLDRKARAMRAFYGSK